MGNPRYANGFSVTLHEDLIDAPKSWKSPRLIFVNSMSDLFHEKVPFWFIKKVFDTMKECPQHTFQILTKRSERLAELAPKLHWAPNIWMGVSIEDKRVLYRIKDLLKVPAAVRFLSCEPLIDSCGDMKLDGIDWVIVGGESGPGAREMKVEWIRPIYRECRRVKAAFFFKQWGGVRKHLTGRLLNKKIYSEMPVQKEENNRNL
jgi:protein gp37